MDPELQSIQTRLLARIHRRFKTRIETHALGPLRLPFTRIADPDAVLDRIVEQVDRREKSSGDRKDGDELHLPYWAELWDSAIGMGAFLASEWNKLPTRQGDTGTRGQGDKGAGRQGDREKGRRHHPLVPLSPSPLVSCSLLDLGCGMGLTSMVAAAMGASVLMADLESDALLFARLNTLPWRARVRARRVNWQRDRVNERFDVIVGADVLYDRKQWEHLDTFFRAHLAESGQVLLGEPGRPTGDAFPEWIEAREWRLTSILQSIPTRPRPIRIFRLVWKG